MPEPNPQASDAILGGQNPPPINAAILPCQINSDSPAYPAHEEGNWDRRYEGHRRWALHE